MSFIRLPLSAGFLLAGGGAIERRGAGGCGLVDGSGSRGASLYRCGGGEGVDEDGIEARSEGFLLGMGGAGLRLSFGGGSRCAEGRLG